MWVAVDPSRGHKGAVNITIECFKTSQTFNFTAEIGTYLSNTLESSFEFDMSAE